MKCDEKSVIFFFFAAFLLASVVAQTNYCTICGGSQTMCLRKTCLVAGACKSLRQSFFTAGEKKEIVAIHNTLRNKVALGEVPNQLPAANMNELIWDEELAMVAQCWANACTPGNDLCRDVPRFRVGQNSDTGIGFSIVANLSGIYTAAFHDWFSNYRFLNPIAIANFTNTINANGTLYSQMVWAETKYIGCARVIKPEGAFGNFINRPTMSVRIICNYGPTGNIVGQSVYKIGLPASQCPSGSKKSTQFPGLCN